MARWGLPGGQAALAKDGRLVLNRGYGLADVDRGEEVQPTSLFRIASTTKAITAVAVLTLVDAGALSLGTMVFPLLGFAPPAGAIPDPRLADVSVQDLLVHAGGWDSAQTFDPQGLPISRTAAATVGLADPAEAATIVRFMLGEPLDFAPGTRQAYSNFGFNVLGRVIEQVSGQPYAEYVRTRVLLPAGITDMRLGRTRLADRAPNEVRYYAPPGQPPAWSVFWGEGVRAVRLRREHLPGSARRPRRLDRLGLRPRPLRHGGGWAARPGPADPGDGSDDGRHPAPTRRLAGARRPRGDRRGDRRARLGT